MFLLNKSRKRPSNFPVIIQISCHERLISFIKYFVYWIMLCKIFVFAKECWIDLGDWTKFHGGGGGGGLRPEVQPLTLLYISFDRKSTPFESHFVNITNDTPITYRKLSCLFHSYNLLGPSADRNDRFPYLISQINRWNPFIYRNP